MIAALAVASAIVASTGPPELFDQPFSLVRLYESLADFQEQTYWYPPDVPVRQWPEALDPGARFGIVNIGLSRRVFVLTAWPHALIVDLDGDGSLADGPRLPLELESSGPVEMLSAVLLDDRPGLPMKLGFPLVDGRPGRQAVDFAYTLRRGTIRVDEKSIAFALVGAHGVYDDPYNAVFFDLDGDGQLALGDRQDAERFQVKDGRLNIDGRSYAFSVDPIGDSLTLTPTDLWVPSRNALNPGSPASSFRFVDLELEAGALEDYRGRVVLLYFWFAGCVPCAKMMPVIADLYDTFHASGFEILAVNTSDSLEIIREYVAAYGFPGRQVPDGDEGPIKELYRVYGVPTWFVIDREGRIAGRSGYGDWPTPVEDVRELFKASAP